MPWAHFTGQVDNGKVWVDRCAYCPEVAYELREHHRQEDGTIVWEGRCFDHLHVRNFEVVK